jgi:hypothetical protein
MATELIPGKIYRVAASGVLPVTLTKNAGAVEIARAALLAKVGDTATFADGTDIMSDTLQYVTASNGSIALASSGTSVLAGATAALRRIVNTAATGPAAPTTATDGYSITGASVLHVVTTCGAGATSWQLYAYDSVSGAWSLFQPFGTSGTLAMLASTTMRSILDVRGIDRIALRVSVNGGAVQCDGWALTV